MATIRPKYGFPHEETYIIDNSLETLVDEPVVDTSTPYLCVFAGPKGPDNQLIKMKSLIQHRKLFGVTDFKTYGQPQLMPEAILGNDQDTSVWAMRVMPEDAKLSNSIVSLWYKKDVENGKFRIKFTNKSITGAESEEAAVASKDHEAFMEYAETAFDGPTVEGKYIDAEGFTQVPLFAMCAAGRGVYGDSWRWRIVRAEDLEKSYECKLFNLQCIDTDGGATIRNTFDFTMVQTPKTNTSRLLGDLIEAAPAAGLHMRAMVFEDNFMNLYAEYVAFAQEVATATGETVDIPDLDQFDPLFGKAQAYDGVRVTPNAPFIYIVPSNKDLTEDDIAAEGYNAADYTATDVIEMGSIEGVSLANGSDGAFASADPVVRAKAIDDAYIAAFQGEADELILAPRRIQSAALFDANYNTPVKMALAQLAFYRASAFLYLDTGMQKTLGVAAINKVGKDFSVIDELAEEFTNLDGTWICSVNTHWYKIQEASSGRRVPVTISYFLAQTDAQFRNLEGSTASRTDAACHLTGHVANSLRPEIQENEMDLKQALYDARINYFETIDENVYQRSTQSTYMVGKKSALLEEPNAIALLNWKKILEDECRVLRNQPTSVSIRKEFRDYLLDKYDYLVGEGAVFETLDIQFKADAYEQIRDIVHLYTQVTFPRRSKVTVIEIQVNKAEITVDEE